MALGDQHRPLRELVGDEIRQRIIAGEMPPGTRLVEDALAQDLGVSRNPVREALRTLEWEGYVAMLPRRGAVVTSLSDEDAHEVQEVRTVLQALAAGLAARKAKPEQAEALSQLVEAGAEALADGDVPALTKLHSRFHAVVLELADNDYLSDVIAPMNGRIEWMFRRHPPKRAQDSWREHAALAEAIAAGDENLATALAAQHIANARAALTSHGQ